MILLPLILKVYFSSKLCSGIEARAHEDQFCELFSLTMGQLKTMLPLTTNLKDAYKSGRDDEQNFIQNMALFISTILKEHGCVYSVFIAGLYT